MEKSAVNAGWIPRLDSLLRQVGLLLKSKSQKVSWQDLRALHERALDVTDGLGVGMDRVHHQIACLESSWKLVARAQFDMPERVTEYRESFLRRLHGRLQHARQKVQCERTALPTSAEEDLRDSRDARLHTTREPERREGARRATFVAKLVGEMKILRGRVERNTYEAIKKTHKARFDVFAVAEKYAEKPGNTNPLFVLHESRNLAQIAKQMAAVWFNVAFDTLRKDCAQYNRHRRQNRGTAA